MSFTRMLIAVLLAANVSAAMGDWVETNKDGVQGGGLDFDGYWVAAYDGNIPKPVTAWYTAAQLDAAGFGSDPAWVENVIAITDADATRFAAENHVESFFDVCVTAGTCTNDTDEEFGIMARASYFPNEGPINALSAYAATFSANDAAAPGDPLKFSLYKIVGGAAVETRTAYPLVPASVDDYIVSIELSVVGGEVAARLFEDGGDSIPMAALNFTDASPLPAGYSGVLCWDVASADGIGVLYDTLESVAVPEPGILAMLASAAFCAFRLRRRRS